MFHCLVPKTHACVRFVSNNLVKEITFVPKKKRAVNNNHTQLLLLLLKYSKDVFWHEITCYLQKKS